MADDRGEGRGDGDGEDGELSACAAARPLVRPPWRCCGDEAGHVFLSSMVVFVIVALCATASRMAHRG
ncbi:hypothetical protein C5C05_03670 [Clavibacter michiganensis]|nr:hypothetical protein C5C05_03670 [Clavibacter michiganensis]